MFVGYLFLASCVLDPALNGAPNPVPVIQRCKPIMETYYNSAYECHADLIRLKKEDRNKIPMCSPRNP